MLTACCIRGVVAELLHSDAITGVVKRVDEEKRNFTFHKKIYRKLAGT